MNIEKLKAARDYNERDINDLMFILEKKDVAIGHGAKLTEMKKSLEILLTIRTLLDQAINAPDYDELRNEVLASNGFCEISDDVSDSDIKSIIKTTIDHLEPYLVNAPLPTISDPESLKREVCEAYLGGSAIAIIASSVSLLSIFSSFTFRLGF